jgi:thiol-disulfide isomerase/thioredoxin
MKSIFVNLALFVILTTAFSGLTSCTNPAKSENGPKGSPVPVNGNNNQSSVPTENNSAPDETQNSEFPPPPSILTEAEIKNIDGTTFKVQDRKGQVMLLNLWATWCGPCRGEMPELIAMQNKYSDKNFKVIGLNTDDEGIDEIKEFAAEMKLNYELAWLDQKTTMGLFRYTRFNAIPQSFLIDREGRLRAVFTGGGPRIVAQMKEAVDKLVNGTEQPGSPESPSLKIPGNR